MSSLPALKSISRRCFLRSCGLSASALVVTGMTLELAGCDSSQPVTSAAIKIKLGNRDSFALGRTLFRLERIALFRDSQGFSAMGLVCTHQECLVRDNAGSELVCPCHGSRFDSQGRVLQGPAVVNLPWYQLSQDSEKQIWIDFAVKVNAEWRLPLVDPPTVERAESIRQLKAD